MTSSELEPSSSELKEAAKELASQRAQKQRQDILEACNEWVWISGALCFVRLSDHQIWIDKQWRAHYAHLKRDGDVLTFVMRNGLVTKYERLVYEPYAEPVLGNAFNLWRPGLIEPAEGDVAWFVEHVRYLFPDTEVAELVLDFMALVVQRPWTKILFALLIYGPNHGTGKTALSELLKRMLGAHNVATPTNEEMSGTFTQWQESVCLVCVNELMMFGRQEVANRLKTDITEPELRIRAMYRAAYGLPNRLNFIASTNHPNALKLENADRRWFVAHSPVKPKPVAYYEQLFAHINSDMDVAAVLYFLRHRKVRLNPKGRAPETQAKTDMLQQSMADEEAYLLELLEAQEWPFDGDLVRRDDLVDAVQKRFPGHAKDLLGRIDTFLKQHGAVQHKRNTTSGDGRKKYRLYSIRHHDHWEKAGPNMRYDAYAARKRNFVADHFEDDADGEGFHIETEASGTRKKGHLTEDGY